ncbi:MFS transporter [Ectothiorhodospiraceae bacterium BW-2]|nr:MFS transporter [Ectothiorhodospiraceae bacterium BW-2]
MSQKKNSPFLELLITIVIPSIILMKLSGEEALGPVWALIVALSLPLGWGGYDLLRHRQFNFFAILGLISVLLTGGIGLLKLDNEWLAVKEAAIPGLIGLFVIASTFTRYSVIRLLLFNPQLINLPLVMQRLEQRGNRELFERRLTRSTWFLGGTFFFSSVMNYFLATWIVTSPSGSEAFNEELGRLTLLSYPMIALPSMVMMFIILWYIGRSVRQLAGLSFTQMLNEELQGE